MIHTGLRTFSKGLNFLLLGRRDQTLCARISKRFGHDCLFCKTIGFLVRDEDHCWKSLKLELLRESRRS